MRKVVNEFSFHEYHVAIRNLTSFEACLEK